MQTAQFNPANGQLWVDISMKGYYSITYAYQLIDTDAITPLTTPIKTGNNTRVDEDDFYAIKNDLVAAEAPAANSGRSVYLWLTVIKVRDDFGYKITVSILQGDDYATAVKIGSDERSGTVGAAGARDEVIEIKLESI